MGKNIIVFSDGTGQYGGQSFDERRSNIYKLYRATRCGPDSSVSPTKQLAFYDPGLGTLPPHSKLGFLGTCWRLFYNLTSQATGLGLTGNIIDCYAEIIRAWRPGDKIFLFGFSRGAYTVRCLSGVIAYCGVPTARADGKPIDYSPAGSRKIAKEAVKLVYQHTESRKDHAATPRQREMLAQRTELGRRFREKYLAASEHSADEPNVYPHFIGVFDTVASLSNPVAIVGLWVVVMLALAAVSSILAHFSGGYWWWYAATAASSTIVAIVVHTYQRIRSEIGLPFAKWWRPFHLVAARMKFYDTDLSPKVAHARHAIALDETRKSFDRVAWGQPGEWKSTTPPWFEQKWFAGNHSDIGGSYPENESRLSDISLQWMLDAAQTCGMEIDPDVLQLHPDPAGMQHDETQTNIIFRMASKNTRQVKPEAPLHESVLARFRADRVRHYDEDRPYRPEALRIHNQVRDFYQEAASSSSNV